MIISALQDGQRYIEPLWDSGGSRTTTTGEDGEHGVVLPLSRETKQDFKFLGLILSMCA